MSSPARKAEKRKLWGAENERLDNERREKEAYFSELATKLEELGIDAHLLKEYLTYIE